VPESPENGIAEKMAQEKYRSAAHKRMTAHGVQNTQLNNHTFLPF
jgi:hypothetical protein